jgi:formylglycine-generating enzyme required for sulfatase activity
MDFNRSQFSPTGYGKEKVAGLDTRRFPVERVYPEDIEEFCRRMTELPATANHGHTYRLPTEAEWEYACRAGSTLRYGFSDEPDKLGDYAWYRENSGNRPHEVGGKKPNFWGLHDMQGNVWEWCADWRGLDYYANSPAKDPTGPSSARLRVVRGGSWWYRVPEVFRCAYRIGPHPSDYTCLNGFRVAATIREGD